MDAALFGTLEIEEPCVWIRTEIGRFTAAFPAGTVVVEGPSLQFGDGSIARSGDTLTGTGGFLRPGDLAAIQISRPVRSCFEDSDLDEVMVFNNQLGIEVSVAD